MTPIHDSSTIAFAAAIGFGWYALGVVWFMRRSGVLPLFLRFWRGSGAFARIASVAALVALSVYGGSKSGGTNGLGGAGTFMVPRPLAGPGSVQ